MLAEKSQPNRPQSVGALQHSLHQPAGVSFAVIGERKLQDMFEIGCQHGKATAVRQAVGKEGDKRSAEDREQAQACPGKDQNPKFCPVDGCDISLRHCEHINDAAKKHRFGEKCQSDRYIGECQKPAQTAVSAKLCENASVELQKTHGRILDAFRLICFLRVVREEA
jgi:hypothetical protein